MGGSGEGLAAVGEEVLAGDVGGGVADEEGDDAGVIGGVGEAAEGDADAVLLKTAAEDALQHLVVVGVHELGAGRAGGDRVDPDAVRSELDGEDLGEAEEALFRRRVGAVMEAGGGDHVRDDVDDGAPLAALHGRHDGPGADEGPAEVDADDRVPVREVEAVDRGEAEDPRVVDEDGD